jgi:hypothetical protein
MGQRPDEVANAGPTTDDVAMDNTGYAAGEFASNAGYDGALNGMPYSEGSPDLYGAQSNAYATDTASEGDFDAGQPDDIEITRIQIQETRSELGSTIDAIQERLSPENLKQQATDTVREATIGKAQNMVQSATDTAQDMVGGAANEAMGFGSAIVETIRENPIPAALAGIGIGWLFMSSRKNSSSSRSYSYAPGRPASRIQLRQWLRELWSRILRIRHHRSCEQHGGPGSGRRWSGGQFRSRYREQRRGPGAEHGRPDGAGRERDGGSAR